MSELWSNLRHSFLTGLLVVVPTAGTVLLLFGVFYWSTDRLLPSALSEGEWRFVYRIVYLALFLALVTLTGWLMRRLIGKRLLAIMEAVIAYVPMLNKTYGFMKQLGDTMMMGNNNVFQQVVVVEYPRPGIYTLAFATQAAGGEVSERTGESLVSVFLPTPPNPTTGYLVLFPREQVVDLDMSVTDAMKMSFTGGSVVPTYIPPPASGGPRA